MRGQVILFSALLALLVNFGYAEPVGTCPEENEEYVTFLTDSEDCSIFYKCDWGVPYKYDCPADLYFNPTLNVCDYPEQTECGSAGENNSDGNVEDGNGESNGTDDEESDGNGDEDADNNDSDNNVDSAVGECPTNNDGDAVHLPHESDCTLFYTCDWGVPVLQECSDGLHFNPVLEVCDYPEDAGCESGTGGSDGENEDNSNDENNGNEGGDVDEVDDEDADTDDSDNSGDSAVGECPANNDGDAVHLPHESNCTLFYTCDWGVPVLQECSDGLHFNPVLEVCDYPEDAGCESGTGGSDGGSEDSNDGESNGNEGGDDDGVVDEDADTGDSDNNGDSTVGECPANNDGNAVHLAHESDCTLFYICDWGVPVLQECSDGLHFNPVLEVCDYPEDAGCESRTEGSDGGNEHEGNDGNNGNESGDDDGFDNEDANTGGSDNNGDSAVGECPADNDGDALHIPHESDCTLFYKCDWGVPVLQECSDGLHFSPVLEVCDYPENAGCESGTDGSDAGNGDDGNDESDDNNNEENDGNSDNDNGDGGNEDTGHGEDSENGDDSDTDNNGEDSNDGSGFCDTVSCPEENEEFVTFIPNTSDCTKFCKCNWGRAYEFICPDGLYFNPSLNVCDYPEDSGCAA